MPSDNVLSLNAFGELIEPRGKREVKRPEPSQPSFSPEFTPQTIPLQRVVTKDEKPVIISDEKGPQSGRNSTGSKQSNHVASKVLKHMSQTKLLHWQTKSVAEHEALDKLFEDLVELGDELTESVMGKYGRPNLSKDEACLELANYENPDSPDGLPRFISEIDDCFRKECAPLFPEESDPEIHNLIQEILGKIDKIAYLLTLRK